MRFFDFISSFLNLLKVFWWKISISSCLLFIYLNLEYRSRIQIFAGHIDEEVTGFLDLEGSHIGKVRDHLMFNPPVRGWWFLLQCCNKHCESRPDTPSASEEEILIFNLFCCDLFSFKFNPEEENTKWNKQEDENAAPT